MIRSLFLVVAALWPSVAMAELALNPLWTDGAVVQRDAPLVVAGKGEPDAKVVVTFREAKGVAAVGNDVIYPADTGQEKLLVDETVNNQIEAV